LQDTRRLIGKIALVGGKINLNKATVQFKGVDIMIPKIVKILYATDLSINSAYAFRYALNTAEKHDAQIDMIYVFETQPISGELILVEDTVKKAEQAAKDANIRRIKERLEVIVKKELQDKPAVMDRVSSIQVVAGDPTVEILKKAAELKSDILVIGTHSKGFVEHAFLGSVAQRLLQRIKIPVFIIPIPKKTDIAFNN